MIVVCVRASMAEFISRGSTADRNCETCGERVFTAPLTKRLLQKRPDAEVYCAECAVAKLKSYAPEKLKVGLAGAPEEVSAEAADPIPNTWRYRN